MLDTAGRVPGTQIRFGLDPVLGLVPGLGDLAGAALSGYIVLTGARLGVPRSVILRMLINVGADTLVGTVPVVGDLFDVAWKSNARNVALLERYLESPAETRAASRATVIGTLAALVLVAGAGLAIAFWVIRAVIGLITR